MFTGIIERVCTVRALRPNAGGLLLAVDLDKLVEDCHIGDSVAINGACLTIAKLDGSLATFELSWETLKKSTLGCLTLNAEVNVERALRPNNRFGGHFVLGHIDGTATIKAVKRLGQFADIEFTAEPELTGQIVPKGSIAVDGISLTIARVNQSSFSIAVIPQTLQKTTLVKAKIGDQVNIEIDIITKAVKRQLESLIPQKQPLTVERLQQLGF
jgi:riboflavin synthase